MKQKDYVIKIMNKSIYGTEQHPDYKGKAMIDGKAKDVAVWLNESKNGKQYFSLKFSEPYQAEAEAPKQNMPQDLPDSDLPF